ncbi:hypothetical protein [Melittangium boletus]|uniref:hypothetical protein n=1 Tax=Melittangium boletus TaxID=83453 RepID=UPI003DA3D5BB
MVGIISSVVFAGLLTASPAGFTFDGPKVTARTVGSVGFFTHGALPYADLFERGRGSADLSVQERIADPRATYGDVGRLEATFTLGATTYRVELDQAGFPPASGGAQATAARPPPPAQPIAGGVVVNQELHGGAPVGFANMTRVKATAAVWGVGRLWRNGQLLTDTAIIHAAALESGAHADDDTFRVLPVARQGDTELSVLVWNIPRELEPRGFVQFDFDDVSIEVNGIPVTAVASIPTVGSFTGVPAPTAPVAFGASLGFVPESSLGAAQGTGGSGFTTTTPSSQDGLADPTLTQQVAPTADTTLPSVAARIRTLPESFESPERVSLSTQLGRQPDPVSLPATGTPSIPEAFQSPERVQIATQSTQTPTTGFVPLNPTSASVGAGGSYTIVPLAPGVSGPEFAFGGARLSAGLVSTPLPLNAQTTAVPLISTPQPLNGLQPVPFVATPPSITATGAVPLISTPQPLNAAPLSGALPGAPTVVTNPAGPNPFAPIQ